MLVLTTVPYSLSANSSNMKTKHTIRETVVFALGLVMFAAPMAASAAVAVVKPGPFPVGIAVSVGNARVCSI